MGNTDTMTATTNEQTAGGYDVRPLFADRYQVTNLASGSRHYVTVRYDRERGEFRASGHGCNGTRFNGFCRHLRAAKRYATQRLNQQMAEFFGN